LVLLLAQFAFASESSFNYSVYSFTNQGLVRGFASIQDNVQVYLGIPFAAPPLRFQPPQPPSIRHSVFDATSFGNPCPQMIGTQYSLLEDCLNLNVYAPANAHLGANLPVLVYWFGGSFIYSSNAVLSNQPQRLANTANVIVVTPNHRLGALGFLYVDELTQADGYKDNKVNFAMLDMIRALTWVQNNIWYFGGDPKKVTIGGHSSGAYMCSFLTTIPQSWDLFSNVIQEEGPLSALDQANVYPKVTANQMGHLFADAVGCTQTTPNELMNCLATTDLLILAEAWQSFVLLPVVDGDLFPVSPEVALTSPSLGHVKPTPNFMISLANPGSIFINRVLAPILEYGWAPFLESFYGPEIGGALAALYPDYIYGTGENSIIIRGGQLISDSVWLCPLRRHASYLTAFTSSVYVAVWNVNPSFFTYPAIYGIVHGSSVPFVFGNPVNLATQTLGKFTPEEDALSVKIMKMVGKFMRTGNPGSEYPAWQPELHSQININNITIINPLDIIRIPPAGIVPPFPGETRCEFYDFLFSEIVSGKIDGGLLTEKVALKFNFWQAK